VTRILEDSPETQSNIKLAQKTKKFKVRRQDAKHCMNEKNISAMIKNETINYSREKKKNQLAIVSLTERRGK
jgi:high-affinity K+ transport system ATPase subunit B